MKNLFTWVIGFACCVSSVQAQQAPYKNPLVPTEMRVNDLLQRMTLKESQLFDGLRLVARGLEGRVQLKFHIRFPFFRAEVRCAAGRQSRRPRR